MGPAQFARNQPPQALDSAGRRRIFLEKLLCKPHRAERHAHRFFDALMFRERDLAAASAEVDEKHASSDTRLGVHDASMDAGAPLRALEMISMFQPVSALTHA